MSILIAGSTRDVASRRIASRLMKKLDLRRIPDEQDMFETDGVYVQMLDRDLVRVQPQDIDGEYDVVVFLSRHSSRSHMKSMTVHATGNFDEDTSLGGRSKQLALAAPPEMRQVLVHLSTIVEDRNLRYRVSYEATHHGPTDLPIRSCFVELGSTEEEWTDDEAADAVAEAVYRSLAARTPTEPFLGIGGTHYAPKFTSFSLNEPYAAGHIIPKYAADLVGEGLILQALEKSDETNLVVIEKKGLNSGQRERFAGMFDKWGVEQILI